MSYWQKLISLVFMLSVSASFAAEATIVERVVAVVNDDIILQTELDQSVERLKKEMKKQNKLKELGSTSEIKKNVLDQLINERLIQGEIEQRGLVANDAMVDRAIASVMQQNGIRSTQDLEKALKAEGLTLESYRTNLKKQIETSQLMSEAIRPRVQITDEDIQAAYRRDVRENQESWLWKTRMIFLKKKKGAKTEKQIARLRRKIEAGVPFSQVADKETQGPGKGKGGLLGDMNPDEMLPVLGQALRKLKPKEVSPVISAPEGFYLLQLVEKVASQAPKLSETRKQTLMAELTQLETAREFDSFVRALRDKAHVEVNL